MIQTTKQTKPAVGPNLSVNFLQCTDILRSTMLEVFLRVWALLLGLGLARPVRILHLKSIRTGDTKEILNGFISVCDQRHRIRSELCLV